MSSLLSQHPFLVSLCAAQFAILSVLATKYLGVISEQHTSNMSSPTLNAAGRITRITMFKVPGLENQKKMVEQYNVLTKEQQRGGNPYIQSVRASIPVEDPRTKGYTVVAETSFANLDDMKYYEDECPAHLALKKASRTLGVTEPPLTVYY